MVHLHRVLPFVGGLYVYDAKKTGKSYKVIFRDFKLMIPDEGAAISGYLENLRPESSV
jgi:hypothetical protein